MAFTDPKYYTWAGAGSLEDCIMRSPVWLEEVCEHCGRLHFTGMVELLNEHSGTIAWQPWFGGEAKATNPSSILVGGQWWFMGPAMGTGVCAGFRVTQRIPDFEGKLTGDIVLRGNLKERMVQRIASLCSKYLLSADVVLQRPDCEAVEVVFDGGCPTSLEIAGATEIAGAAQMKVMSASRSHRLDLIELSTWSTGSYEVRLHPLFGAETYTSSQVHCPPEEPSI